MATHSTASGQNNNTKIVSPNNSRNAYGNICVDSTNDAIHKWVFKIGEMTNGHTSIGIVESSVNESYESFTKTGRGYACRGDGYIVIPKSGKGINANYECICGKHEFKQGDTITMIYTSKHQTLSYSINNNPTCVTINHIKSGHNIKYKMATYLYRPQDSLKLISYQLNISNNIAKEEKKETLMRNQTKINMNTLQQKISDLKHEQQQLEIERLKQMNQQLMMEQKKSRLEIKNLKNEVKTLQSQNLDVNNYKTWKWQEILQWIMTSENRKFKQYEQDLRYNLSVEQPLGSDLNKVNEGDIRRWGVTKFSDIKILCSNIQELVNYNEDNIIEEGVISPDI